MRDAYGRNIYGQSVLLARRLIEAGTRVACISWAPDANATWDTHGKNFVKLKNDSAAAVRRGLHQPADRPGRSRNAGTDAGRGDGRVRPHSPKVNGAAGRDHWNFCYGLLLAGGGIRAGYVHGASDKIGAFPARNAMTPGDCISTLYHVLGIDPGMFIHDQFNRPHRLVPKGEVISELLI